MDQKPILNALLLADNVYRDGDTGKFIIAGLFRQLWGSSFPSKFGRPTSAYVSLTDMRGTFHFRLRYVDLSDNRVLMETKPIEVISEDPLGELDFVIGVPPFPMPHPCCRLLE